MVAGSSSIPLHPLLPDTLTLLTGSSSLPRRPPGVSGGGCGVGAASRFSRGRNIHLIAGEKKCGKCLRRPRSEGNGAGGVGGCVAARRFPWHGQTPCVAAEPPPQVPLGRCGAGPAGEARSGAAAGVGR